VLISELAARTGSTTRALRHYDRAGLLPSRRSVNRYRDFPEEAVERVRRIRLLLNVGLNLEDVERLLPCFVEDGSLAPCSVAQQRLTTQIHAIDVAMAQLCATKRMLADTLAQMRR
jgi:MerR family copper efflux transcriptional regulator